MQGMQEKGLRICRIVSYVLLFVGNPLYFQVLEFNLPNPSSSGSPYPQSNFEPTSPYPSNYRPVQILHPEKPILVLGSSSEQYLENESEQLGLVWSPLFAPVCSCSRESIPASTLAGVKPNQGYQLLYQVDQVNMMVNAGDKSPLFSFNKFTLENNTLLDHHFVSYLLEVSATDRLLGLRIYNFSF